MTHRIEDKKWILYRHTNSFDLISAVAVNLKTLLKGGTSKEDKYSLLERLRKLDYYKERNPELPLDSINHRINTLAYYMFGYKESKGGNNRFLFSPLGNLFLQHVGNKEKSRFIFLTMLWGLQFKHPHGGSDDIFNLYPFRLIFKLLMDERLGKKLFVPEVAYLVVFTVKSDIETYEKLVNDILRFRKSTTSEVEEMFKKNEHLYVNSVYEWDYYVTTLFESAGIINKINGEKLFSLLHGTSTKRYVKNTFITINSELEDFCNKLEQLYSFDQKPVLLYDENKMSDDVVKEIYSFYPEILLKEISETGEDLNIKLFELPKLIEKYADNEEGLQSSLFEDILEEGFNMFYNVTANKISGAGNTDIECLFIPKKKKFAVEAKSTKNKLSNINSGRLKRHLERIGGQYTIVITPRYVPSVKYDIKNTNIVIITASTFSEYLYNNINNLNKEIDYSDFDNIIISNLGKDISQMISTLTLDKFGISNTVKS